MQREYFKAQDPRPLSAGVTGRGLPRGWEYLAQVIPPWSNLFDDMAGQQGLFGFNEESGYQRGYGTAVPLLPRAGGLPHGPGPSRATTSATTDAQDLARVEAGDHWEFLHRESVGPSQPRGIGEATAFLRHQRSQSSIANEVMNAAPPPFFLFSGL